MKKLIVVVILFCLVSSAYAQKHGDRKEQFMKAQFQDIVKCLELDSQKVSELEPLYIAFMKELRPDKSQRKFAPLERESEEQIDAMTRAKLAMAVHIAMVREKYYDQFRKILAPSQIMKMYQVERDIMKRVKHEFKLRSGDE